MEDYSSKNSSQGFGIASLVLGIMALVLAIIPCVGVFGVLFGILAIIFGAISLSNASRYKAPRGMGLSGLLLGIGSILLVTFWMVFFVGAQGFLEDKLDFLNKWNQQDVNVNIDDEFEDVKSLDELEAALDELETQLTDSLENKDINVNVGANGAESDENN